MSSPVSGSGPAFAGTRPSVSRSSLASVSDSSRPLHRTPHSETKPPPGLVRDEVLPDSGAVMAAYRLWEQTTSRELRELETASERRALAKAIREQRRTELLRAAEAWAGALWASHQAGFRVIWRGSAEAEEDARNAWHGLEEAQSAMELHWSELRQHPEDDERSSYLELALEARQRALLPLGLAGIRLELAGGSLRALPSGVDMPSPSMTIRPTMTAEVTAPETLEPVPLHELLDELHPLTEALTDTSGWMDELGSLSSFTGGSAMRRWLQFPAEQQRLLLELIASRARHVQDERDYLAPAGDSLATVPLDQIFRRINRFSQNERPGFAHGLSRSHRPREGTWIGDSIQLLEQLRGSAGPREERLGAQLTKLEHQARLRPSSHRDKNIRKRLRNMLRSGNFDIGDPRLLRVLKPVKDSLCGEEFEAIRSALNLDFDSDIETSS